MAFQFDRQFDWLLTTIADLSFLNLCRRNVLSTNVLCVISQKNECLNFIFHFAGDLNRTHPTLCHLEPFEKGQRDVGMAACFNAKGLYVPHKRTVIKQTTQAHDIARRPPRNKVPLAETHKY